MFLCGIGWVDPLSSFALTQVAGSFVFSSFRMVPQWTDLPMRNSFLPLLAELCGVRERGQQNGGVLRVDSGSLNGMSSSDSIFSSYGLLQQGDQKNRGGASASGVFS